MIFVFEGAEAFAQSWVMMATAAVGAASALVGNMQKNSALTREIQQYAVDMVAIEVQAGMQQESLIQEAAAVAVNTQQRELQVEQSAMSAEANNKVAAAVSGSAGTSVDTTAGQVGFNAGTAAGNLATQEQNQLNAIEQESRNIVFGADAATGKLDVADQRGGLLNIFNQGLSGFLMGR